MFHGQNYVVLSTIKVKCIVACELCKIVIYLACLVEDMGIHFEPLILHNDTVRVIKMAHNSIFHVKIKHIKVCYHFIRTMINDMYMKLVKIYIDDNPTLLFIIGV